MFSSCKCSLPLRSQFLWLSLSSRATHQLIFNYFLYLYWRSYCASLSITSIWTMFASNIFFYPEYREDSTTRTTKIKKNQTTTTSTTTSSSSFSFESYVVKAAWDDRPTYRRDPKHVRNDWMPMERALIECVCVWEGDRERDRGGGECHFHSIDLPPNIYTSPSTADETENAKNTNALERGEPTCGGLLFLLLLGGIHAYQNHIAKWPQHTHSLTYITRE